MFKEQIILPPPLHNQQKNSMFLPPPPSSSSSSHGVTPYIWDYSARYHFQPFTNNQSSNDQITNMLSTSKSHNHYSHGSSPNFLNNDQLLFTPTVMNPLLPPIVSSNTNTNNFTTTTTNTTNTTASSSVHSLSPLSSPLTSNDLRHSTSRSSSITTPIITINENLDTVKVKKPTKQRKKKQCPECHLFFSNISTHKSTHLPTSNRPYQCSICARGFSRSNDLYRHSKRHWKENGSTQGAFKCPYSSVLLQQKQQEGQPPSLIVGDKLNNLDDDDMPCHQTGIFSRCDTYKNHLKALHFIYPPGTRKRDRSGASGNCKKCGKLFKNVDDWLTNHVENHECGYEF